MKITSKIPAIITTLLLTFAITNPSFSASSPGKNATDGMDKYKTKAPIEITSDSLEVLQQANKAVFTGHVVAVQGDIRMKSEKMTVFYKNTEPEPTKHGKTDKDRKKEKSLANAEPEKKSIEKIVVEKNVFLATPQETASGSRGLYDVVHHKIYLNDNVVLTRDKNVLKGDRLIYDLTTGKSELNFPEPTGSTGAGKTNQRVKALFVPDGDKKLPLKK